MYIGVMETGDPKSFFSSCCVFYAMLSLDYFGSVPRLKNGIIVAGRYFTTGMAAISFAGLINFFSIKEFEGQFWVCFSKIMRLGEMPLVNVHYLFLIMSIIAVLFTGAEWVFSIDQQSADNTRKKLDQKGA